MLGERLLSSCSLAGSLLGRKGPLSFLESETDSIRFRDERASPGSPEVAGDGVEDRFIFLRGAEGDPGDIVQS